MNQTPHRPAVDPRALSLGFAGFAVWTMGDAAIKHLAEYSPFLIACITSFYSVLLLLCFAPYLGGLRATLTKPKMGLQLLRGAVLGVCWIATFYAFTHLQMVVAFAIVFLSPLCAKILSVILNREHVALKSWIISLIGFSGVLVVLQPGSIPIGTGEIAALSIPILFSLGFVLSRTIGEENQTRMSTTLFVSIATLLLTLIPAYHHAVPIAALDYPFIPFIAITGAVGTVLVSKAYMRAPAAYVSPLHYTQIIWGVIWGIVFFNEYPNMPTIIGTMIIVGAGLVLIYMSRRDTAA